MIMLHALPGERNRNESTLAERTRTCETAHRHSKLCELELQQQLLDNNIIINSIPNDLRMTKVGNKGKLSHGLDH